MEWISSLFGGSAPAAAPPPPRIPSQSPSTASKKPESAVEEGGFDIKGFDPRGLERAAKASKELADSPLSKEILQLQKEEVKSKQLQSAKDVEEAKAKQQAFAVERARAEGEEQRKSIEYQHQANQQSMQQQDRIARQRHQDELQAQAAQRGQELRRQEETANRIEEMKKRTLEYEAQLRQQTEQSKAISEAKGRIQQERENFDLVMQRAKLESQEYRTTVLNGINEFGKVAGEGIKDFLQDRAKLTATLGLVSGAFLSFYLAKNGTKFGFQQLEARLGKPPLIRDTSRNSVVRNFNSPLKLVKSLFSSNSNPLKSLDGVVFEPKLRSRLSNLASSTLNTRKNNAPFRHALFYGSPGTGKTLFAKRLAKESGMDYAIMAGGDIAPLGRDAVQQIHSLFDWAEKSPKGLVIFVDEADAFLRKRNDEHMSEDARNALNAFLYRTGTETKHFMLVFASNLPDQLDYAVLDRADEAIEFTLPGSAERVDLLKLYFDKYVKQAPKSTGLLARAPAKIKLDGNVDWDSKLTLLAPKLEGFSGREISKLAIALQASAYGTASAELTEALFDEVVANKLKDHAEKKKWRIDTEKHDE
ncbi:hypothetical protein BASA81_000485 [Batrachochytrium salamandrivorans]|nr:hypothetical protein BASA81_000485 [Batrachochytrium salamandrivorans]